MCGIAGFIPTQEGEADAAWPERCLDALAHRGPDDKGVLWVGSPGGAPSPRAVALAHRRLSIIDLSGGGHQPMSTADGTHLVFNGEIYNHVELRRELEAEGVRFASSSDTEVLLWALTRWGDTALGRLVGMFAFAFVDERSRTALLARDPFGIKPLYHTTTEHGFAFASEIPPLLDLRGGTPRAEPQRLYDYLRYGNTDHGALTMFEGIRQVPMAHALRVPLDAPAAPEPEAYWSIDLDQHAGLSFGDAADRLREMFLDNIRLHLRSDVPVGVCLSGGIDSSAIACAMRHMGGPDAEIHSFSYAADDPRLNEEHWIGIAEAHARTTPHRVRPDSADLFEDMDRLIAAHGEPFGSTSIYAQYRVFRAAKEAGVKVLLDGQGADELFAGYKPYRAARIASALVNGRLDDAAAILAAHPGRLRTAAMAAGLLTPAALQPIGMRAFGEPPVPAWMDGRWAESRGVETRTFWRSRTGSPLREMLAQAVTLKSLPHLLRYEDRNAMAHSIESRVPFLTLSMAEFVFALPEDFLIGRRGQTKRVLRAALRGLVPDEILDRRDKIGFETPEGQWLSAHRDKVGNIIGRARGAGDHPLDLDEVAAQARHAADRPGAYGRHVWRCVNALQWAELFGVELA